MKKVFSVLLTMAFVITSVTAGSLTAKAATPVDELYAIMKQSDGLVIGGKSYDSSAIASMLKSKSPTVTSFSCYELDYKNEYDDMGYYYCWDRRNIAMRDSSNTIDYYQARYDAVKGGVVPSGQEAEVNKPCKLMSGYSDIYKSVAGGYTTNELAARNINAQYLATYMQAHNFTTAEDIAKYLMANGVTFCKVEIVDTGKTGRNKYKTTRTPMPSEVVLTTPSDSGPYSAVVGNITISYDISTVTGGGTISYDDNGNVISDTSVTGKAVTLGIDDSKNQFRISTTIMGEEISTSFSNSPFEYQKTEL